MTTPAIDIHSALSGPGYYVDRDDDGNVIASGPYRTLWWKLRDQHRPESTSHPRNPITGWRNPGSFYHSGYNCNPCPIGSVTLYWTYGGSTEYGDGAGWDYDNDGAVPDVPDSLRDRVVGKALSKLKNQKVNLALAALERAETAELAVDAIHKITALTRAFRSKDPKTFFRRSLGLDNRGNRGKPLPEAYLQWKYGVEPLMTDVHGACEALREKDAERPPVLTIKASSSVRETSQWIKQCSQTGTCGFDVQVQTQYHMALRLDYELTNAVAATLASVGITNPLELAWERLPFSFVADWFIPVGNWLGYLDADLGYQLKSGVWSEISRRSSVGSFRFFGPAGYVKSAVYAGSPYRYNGWNFKRGLYGSTPLPSIGFKNPFPKNGVHIANAAALLAAVFSGR